MISRMILTVATVLFLSMAFEVNATSIDAPEKKEVASANGEYILKVNPNTNKHVVIKKGTKKALWKFNQAAGLDDWIVSNDGSKVVWIAWRHVKKEDLKKPCIAIYNKDGKKQQFTYSEVSVPRKRGDRERGPIGDFWRIWRLRGSVKLADDTLSIEVIGKKPIEIKLK